ncbi:MAG: phytoene desaturase family protein [Betaproteobacteria bacterium]
MLLPDGHADEGDLGWVAPQIERALQLKGLQVSHPDPWAVAPLPQGGRLELWRDMARSVEAIRRVSPADAQKWPAFCSRMARLARFLAGLYLAPPPDPLAWRFAVRARALGRQGLVDLMRLLPMSAAELLDDWFESDVLKGVLGAAAVLDLQQGPRSGGTAFRLLHHHVGCPPGVFRPPRSNLKEVLSPPPSKAAAVSIPVREGRVRGVVLADGEEIEAPLVLSAAHPRRTLLELVDPVWLDPELVRGLRHLRERPVAARVALQLDRAPGFSTLLHAPSLDYLERAYDDAKYGRVSPRPLVEAHCDARHRVEALVQYAPAGADTRALGDVDAATLSEHLGDAVIESVEVAPAQQPHHVELALDQALWMRPLPQLAHYRTPIKGLWLCGAAMHPGGAIAGAAGYNAARAALRG